MSMGTARLRILSEDADRCTIYWQARFAAEGQAILVVSFGPAGTNMTSEANCEGSAKHSG
jgi:hypothetical protein